MYYLIYNVAATLLVFASVPFLPLLLLSRRVRVGFAERFGFYPASVMASAAGARPIWIHGASVGEIIAAGQLSRELKSRLPGKKIIVSTFTMTGNAMARKATAADAVVFLPLDHPWSVGRAFRQIDPSVLIVVETEIWPNLLRQAHRRGVPTLLVSGRLSAGSLKRYSFFRAFFRQVLHTFSLLGMQSDADAKRIVSLGADAGRVRVLGNLKHAVSAFAAGEDNAGPNRNANSGLLLVAGSSHAGEEETLIGVYRTLKLRFPTLRMVLAPRHPPRFLEVEKLLQSHRLEYEKKSRINGSCAFEQDVLLLDTLGDLEQFYAVGDVAFVGGSLVDEGGHNLLEPARFGKPVVFGPYTQNFAVLASEMKRCGAGIEVSGAAELEQALASLLADEERRRAAGEKAYRIAAEDRGVMQQTLAAAYPYLPSE